MAKAFTEVVTTLLEHMGSQTEHLHNSASQTVAIPLVWRTPDQRSKFGQRWAGLHEPRRVREVGFLEAFRKQLGATVLLRLALLAEARHPRLLAAAPELNGTRKDGTLAQKIVSQVRKWPSSELRKAADFASQMGKYSPLDCALIRFPSRTFKRLPHEGIETMVLAFFPNGGTQRSSAYQQLFGIVNGGMSEFGSRRSLKTQHEDLVRHLIYNLRKDAEDAWMHATSMLKQIKTADDPSVVLYFLRQQAEAAADCGYKLPKQWDTRLLDAASHEFSFAVGGFLSRCERKPRQIALTTGRQRLRELGAWLGRSKWLDLLSANNKTPLRRAGMILTNAMADISGVEPMTEPIPLKTVARRLAQRLGASPFFVRGLGLTGAEIRGLFQTHLKSWYCEQDCTATVLQTDRSRARIEVQGEDEGEMFRASVSLGSLPDRPREGDRYKLVVWDLWHHWFGIAAARKAGSAIPKWTPKKRRRFEEGLKNIKCGPVIERRGRS